MRLSDFPDNTKVKRTGWRKGLYGIKTEQDKWIYFDNGHRAGQLSQDMLQCYDFTYYEKKVVIMENVNFVGGEYNVVAIKLSGKAGLYNFKIASDIPVSEDSLVAYHSAKGLGIGTVKKAYTNTFENAEEISKATAWIINVVDNTDHLNRIKASAKREYIVKQLEERKQAMEASQVYEALGSIDPIAKKLLKQLKKLV